MTELILELKDSPELQHSNGYLLHLLQQKVNEDLELLHLVQQCVRRARKQKKALGSFYIYCDPGSNKYSWVRIPDSKRVDPEDYEVVIGLYCVGNVALLQKLLF